MSDAGQLQQQLNNALNLFQQQRFTQAQQVITKVLAQQPQHAHALLLEAIIVSEMAPPAQAQALFEKLLQQHADFHDARLNYAIFLAKNAEYQQAAAMFAELIRRDPSQLAAYPDWARCLIETGDYKQAREVLAQQIKLNPNDSLAHTNLASVLNKLQAYQAAQQAAEQALHLDANLHPARLQLGLSLHHQHHYQQAEKIYRQLLQEKPKQAQLYISLSHTLKRLARYEEVITLCQQALALNPKSSDAYENWIYALYALGHYQEAEELCQRFLQVMPESAAAEFHLGRIRLLQQQLPQAWVLYERRLQFDNADRRQLIEQASTHAKQLMPFDSVNDKNILILHEQGVGDQIQFIRFAEHLKKAGAKQITVYCEPRLFDLFNSMRAVDRVCNRMDDLDFDCFVPMLSLPYVLHCALGDLVASMPYLQANQAMRKQLRDRYLPNNNALLIGVGWTGGGLHNLRLARQLPLVDLLEHLQVDQDCAYLSLQHGDIQASADSLPEHLHSAFIWDKEIDPVQNINGFAAQIAACDLIVSSDSTIVHLAGALNKPVWTLLPKHAEWRWFLARNDSPWYPSMRLFRQTHAYDWTQVLTEVKEALIQFTL